MQLLRGTAGRAAGARRAAPARRAVPLPAERASGRMAPPPPRRSGCRVRYMSTESTDLDVDAQAAQDLGLYVFGAAAALHVGFQGPGWRAQRDADEGTRLDFCSPGRVRLSFGAAAGEDSDGEALYEWGRAGWGPGGRCLGNSLGDEKARFYLSAKQAARILAAPGRVHVFEQRFVGWRGDVAGCPVVPPEELGPGGEVPMTKTLTWRPLAPAAANGGSAGGGALRGSNGKAAAPAAASEDAEEGAFQLALQLSCADGFVAGAAVQLGASDYIMLEQCVKYAIPRMLGLPAAFRLPAQSDID